jgi:D-alanyl-D-alanine carboxypeptidase
MKPFYRITHLFMALLFSSFMAYGQKKDDYSAKIDSFIQCANVRSFNGVILIVQNGKTKYAKAFGYANFDKKTPLKLRNPFEIMSNSKQITAVLLLREVEKGNVNLQSPIKKYLPYLTIHMALLTLINHCASRQVLILIMAIYLTFYWVK